ncbi:MAG: winged helix-turn-helix transcriptional regulator [Sedimentisphaerales bacterium]|nr:winged helix-turn-helix transcriptional regulator [Sedimentisphaerales bacterium]
MSTPNQKLYQCQAEILQALAHPIRLAIVDFLKSGPQCVCDIAQHIDAQRSNVSRHLALMLKSGILDCEKQGLKVIYTLKTPCITSFLSCVNQVVKNQAQQTNTVLQLIDQNSAAPQ